MNQGRPFSQATIGGNPVGRPATAPPEPSRIARALIAARQWQAKQGTLAGQAQSGPRAAQSGAAINAARGQQRRETRFDGEQNIGRAERLPRPVPVPPDRKLAINAQQ